MAEASLPEMPCGPILELHGQRKRFAIPFGLRGLLEDITREILRTQPENIYDFLAAFLEDKVQKKLEAEEKARQLKSWQMHQWSWEASSILEEEDLNDFLDSLLIPVEEATAKAIIIQSGFRGYKARERVKEIRLQLSGQVTAGVCDEMTDEEILDSVPGWQKIWDGEEEVTSVLPPKELEEFLEDLDKRGLDKETVEIKAVIIQSAFRGAMARKKVAAMRIKAERKSGEADVSKLDPSSAPSPTDEEEETETMTQDMTIYEEEGGEDEEEGASEAEPVLTEPTEARPSLQVQEELEDAPEPEPEAPEPEIEEPPSEPEEPQPESEDQDANETPPE